MRKPAVVTLNLRKGVSYMIGHDRRCMHERLRFSDVGACSQTLKIKADSCGSRSLRLQGDDVYRFP